MNKEKHLGKYTSIKNKESCVGRGSTDEEYREAPSTLSQGQLLEERRLPIQETQSIRLISNVKIKK